MKGKAAVLKNLAAALALLLAGPVSAACPSAAPPSAAQVADLAKDWTAKIPATPPTVDDLAAGYCGQALLTQRLAAELGPVIGYKAALTTKPAQERFGLSQPVRGSLLKNMLLADGATVGLDFAARPLWEADLMVEVKGEELNGAATPEQALAGLSALIPFIELPDFVVRPEVKVNGATLALINAGARAGVAGTPVPLTADAATLQALGKLQITATDQTGAVLAQGTGAMALGHPLNAVLWLVKDLNAAGIRLKAGDLLSLGAFSPLAAPKAGQTVTVRYDGLPGGEAPTVSVRFR